LRNTETIKNLVIEKARADASIRAVLLNGSRANPNIETDKFQDFDIVYIVNDLQTFVSDHSWVDYFGKRIIWQLPDEMDLGNGDKKRMDSFTYLMQFEDGNRIDLTLLVHGNKNSNYKLNSLSIVWLDKDNLFSDIPTSNEADYLIRKPTEKQYQDTCNEFWWVSTYVAKGLMRNEITYAKEMLETVVRPMFMKMIEWHIGTETKFSVSFGKCGRFGKKYIPEETYEKILKTYSNHELKNNWDALFLMTELFGMFSISVSDKMSFSYNQIEEKNVSNYLRELYLDLR
jgi:aminoglycoside 6-adenylyltransferase